MITLNYYGKKSRNVPLFRKVVKQILKYIIGAAFQECKFNITEHYKRDFEVYGYGFRRNADGSVLTECNAVENNGDKCC